MSSSESDSVAPAALFLSDFFGVDFGVDFGVTLEGDLKTDLRGDSDKEVEELEYFFGDSFFLRGLKKQYIHIG